VEITPADGTDLSALLTADAYRTQIGE